MNKKATAWWPQNGILRTILGIFMVLMGIIGLFLPFLQGILFISIGLSLLGIYPHLRASLRWLKQNKAKK